MNQVTLLPPRPRMRHVLGMADLAPVLMELLQDARRLKAMHQKGPLPRLLQGKAVLLVFEKHSTRTRVSFEIGIQRLGGMVSSLDANTSQIVRGESLEDTGAVLSRYGDAIVYRAKDHDSLTGLADHSAVPVVNALTDLEHPCQVLADWMTILERWGSLRGRTFTFIGDGNNMCHSYLLAAPMVGMHVRICTPPGYGPRPEYVLQAQEAAQAAGTTITICHDPALAVRGADAVATDTWINMGEEAEEGARLAAFAGYTVDEELLAKAGEACLFLHCLPGHWGLEATHGVAHGARSVIYAEAENRMWVQMALLVHLLRTPGQAETTT